MLFHNTSFTQKYYLNNLNDSTENGPVSIFVYDSIAHTYLFNIWNFTTDANGSRMTNKLIITDLNGQVLKSKSEFQHFDTCFYFQNAYKINNNKSLLVGLKKNKPEGFYVNDIYLRSIDSNLNTISEKIIYLGDSAKYVFELFSIITKNNTLLLIGTRDSANPYTNNRIFLYELSLNLDSIKYAEYSINSLGFSVIERTDSAGYIFMNDYDPSKKIYYVDTNLILRNKKEDMHIPNLMGINYMGDNRKLLSLNDGYFIESKRAFKNAKYWHWLMKYRDDMTYIKYAATPSEIDTSLDFGHYAAYKFPIAYSQNSGLYTLESTRTNEYGPMNFNNNYLLVCRYDTALNLIWSKFLGGDGYNYFPISIFTAENGSCMALCTRSNLDTLAPILQESYIFKLDTTGTLVSVQNISNPDQLSVYMFPNPTFDDVNCWIQNLSSNTAIMNVYNQMGQVVLSTSVSNGKNILNMSHCKPGIYQYSLVSKDRKIQHGKILKQ